eukprot:6491419-Amphidinium_carterae.1
MEGCKGVSTSGVREDQSTRDGNEDAFVDVERHSVFRAVCGRLQYASPRRPDILYPLKELGRALSGPRESDWSRMKHLLRYIQSTKDVVLVHRYSGIKAENAITAQADSDWAGCRKSRKSTSCGLLWWSGILVSSYCRTQSTIATSSPESEYYGACQVAAEALFIRELLSFLEQRVDIVIELDASSAIAIGNRTGLGRTRHVDVRYLWLQQLVSAKRVRLQKVRGVEHPPDVGTKYLGKAALEAARMQLGLHHPSDVPGYRSEEGPQKVKDRLKQVTALMTVATMGGARSGGFQSLALRPSMAMLVLAFGGLPGGADAVSESESEDRDPTGISVWFTVAVGIVLWLVVRSACDSWRLSESEVSEVEGQSEVSEVGVHCQVTESEVSEVEVGVHCQVTESEVSEVGVHCQVTESEVSEVGVQCQLEESEVSEVGVQCQLTESEAREVGAKCQPTAASE